MYDRNYRDSERSKTESNQFDEFLPYWNASCFLFAVCLGGKALEPFIGYRAIGFLFLLAVLLTGYLGKLGPVLFAATISWLAWDYIFIPPEFTFAIGAPEDLLMCLTYFFVALATGILANRVRGQEEVIREREVRTNLLYEVMLDISTSPNQSGFLARIADRLSYVLHGDCSVFLNSPDKGIDLDHLERLSGGSQMEADAAAEALKSGQMTGWSTEKFETAQALYVPIKGNNETVGVFRFKPDQVNPLNLELENLLQSVCKQVGIILEQRFVEKRLREAEQLRESEKIHQTLLNSISHEMRTPLTIIVGSASALEQENSFKNEASRKVIIGELKRASGRLNRVVENLLDMSRLSAGGMAIKREWHEVSDLVGVTVGRLQDTLDERMIKIEIPDDLPMVEIDFRLIEHALSNVLVNAVAYSPPGSEVTLRARSDGRAVRICVDDQGPGLGPEYTERVFEMFYRVPGSPPGGTGLGLSIAKSILEFHEGTISARNRLGGGSTFELSLPLRLSPALPKETNE